MKSVAAVLLALAAMPAFAIWPFDDEVEELQEAAYEFACCEYSGSCEGSLSKCVENRLKANVCGGRELLMELREKDCYEEYTRQLCDSAVHMGYAKAADDYLNSGACR